jgi:hypothetical protein
MRFLGTPVGVLEFYSRLAGRLSSRAIDGGPGISGHGSLGGLISNSCLTRVEGLRVTKTGRRKGPVNEMILNQLEIISRRLQILEALLLNEPQRLRRGASTRKASCMRRSTAARRSFSLVSSATR